MRVLVVFSPVRYLSQVSDSSTLHPVQLFPDHGLGIVVFILGDHGVIVSPSCYPISTCFQNHSLPARPYPPQPSQTATLPARPWPRSLIMPARIVGEVLASGEGGPVGLIPGEGADRPTLVVAIMGVTAPSPLSSSPGASRKQTSSFPGPPRRPALGALPSPRPWVHRLPPRRHRHCRPAVGNRRPSAPTPMPLTGTAAPGTGPGAGPGAWSGQGSSSRTRAWRRTFFLMAAARSCPQTSVGQSPPHRPSCDSPPPSPRHHRHHCLASRRGPLPLGPRPDAGVPVTRPPLPAPGGKPGDWDSLPPVLYAWSGHHSIFWAYTVFALPGRPRRKTPPR